MRYQQFLFTRNQRRDFTAFIRPADMTNKEVSTLASAFNFVNDITPLTPAWPALYCFPLGAYTVVLRHYNSGRAHAGRPIPIIEGIAVAYDEAASLRPALPDLLARHADILNPVAAVGDIELLEVVRSEIHDLDTALDAAPPPETGAYEDGDVPPAEPSERPPIVVEFESRYPTDRLVVPFTTDGQAMLLAALTDDTLPDITFAFGTNLDVVARFEQAGIDFDVIGLLTAEEPAFRPRPAKKVIEARDILPRTQPEASLWPRTALESAPTPLETEPLRVVNVGEETELPLLTPPSKRRSLLRTLLDFLLGR